MTLRRPLLVFAVTVAATLGLDQLTKAMVRSWMPVGDSILLLPGILYLTHVENMGAAFGVLAGQRAVFIPVSLSVLLVVGIYLWRQRPTSALVVIALGLVCAGAVGNLIDRTLALPGIHPYPTVTDFFEFGFIRFPVFNVADTAIVVGVSLLVLWLLISPARPSDDPAEAPGGPELGADSEEPSTPRDRSDA